MTSQARRTRGRRRRRDSASRPALPAVLGVLLLVAGLGCLGWLGYQYVGSDVVAHQAYERETRSLRSQWAAPVPGSRQATPPRATGSATPVPQGAVALLRVPRFGAGFEVPVVAGTGADDLARGVGHYSSTAGPGEVGNFAVAGHRITHGAPFARLLELRRGDQVLVETRAAVFTYVMDTSPADLTVQDTAGWVLDPVPGVVGAPATRALITLTTCQDLFHSPDRSVGFGHLRSTQNK